MRLELAHLHAMAKIRPQGYVEDVLSRAKSITSTHYEISAADFRSLQIKYRNKSESRGPGDAIKFILGKIGYTSRPSCGCDEFRRRMNEWGYWGCIRHRREIIEWFLAKSAEAGLPISRKSLWGLIKAGISYAIRHPNHYE